MTCDKCHCAMTTVQVETPHDPRAYYFRSTCTKNKSHVVRIEPKEEPDEVTA